MKNSVAFLFLLFVCRLGAQEDFDALDARSRAFEKAGFQTPEALAAAICRDVKTEQEKARAIFTWIAGHIRYQKVSDPAAQTKKEYYDRRVKQVYRSGRGVCMDYSLLYQRMAQAVGLRCELIEGHAKTFSGNWESHAWNAVYLEEQWVLLDATWGAGYRDEKGDFVPEFQSGYFATAPRIFLLNHFPDQSKWQLMEEPIDVATFKKLSHYAYGNLKTGIQDAIMEKSSGGFVSLKMNIRNPPTYLYIHMSGKDLSVNRKDQDGWTTLTFKPTAAQKFEIWGGEKRNQKIHLTLMGQFNLW